MAPLFLSTFVKLTSDSDFDNLDPSINWTVSDSKVKHCPIQLLFEVLNVPVRHGRDKMDLLNYLEHDY